MGSRWRLFLMQNGGPIAAIIQPKAAHIIPLEVDSLILMEISFKTLKLFTDFNVVDKGLRPKNFPLM